MAKEFSLSSEEKQFFGDNGYVGPFTLFQPEEMQVFWEETRVALLDRSTAPFPNTQMNYDRHLDVPQLNAVISNPRIVDRIASILGPDVLSWRTEWFPKYPGDEGTDWHQAESFVEFQGTEKLVPTEEKPGMPWELTAWIAMTETTVENGCMKVMPGTHRTWFFDEKRPIPFEPEKINRKVVESKRSGFYGYDWDRLKLDKDWKPDESQAVQMELKAGQFFIFTSRTLHGANPNSSKDSVRFGWATRFVPSHVQVYPGQSQFEHFGDVFPLDRYATVLVSGEDRHRHNRVTLPLAAQP